MTPLSTDLVNAARQYETGDAALINLLGALADAVERHTRVSDDFDQHNPEQFAAWLRKRAEENRRVAALPKDKWPHSPELLSHLAFRFDQGAALVERLGHRENEIAKIIAWALSCVNYHPEHGAWLSEAAKWLNGRRAPDVPAEPR